MEFTLNDTLNAQINTELWSAYLFLSMSVSAESKGYKGVADWFYVQHEKEFKDAKKIIDFLNSIDSKLYLYPIEAVPTEWDSPLEMFRHKLEHDRKIYRLINVAETMAEEMGDGVCLSFLTEFAKEQLKEEAVSKELVKAFESVDGDKDAICLLDKRLGERKSN